MQKAMRISNMTFSKALYQIVLVIFMSLTVSGAGQEMSITRGETAKVPCVFGEGTLKNIYWYFNNGTGPQQVLMLFKGDLVIDAAYTSRAGLYDDNTTLLLKEIAVKDEGIYRCDVERQANEAVPNINTKLKVYGLAPNTSPTIRQCANRPSNCSCCTLTSHGSTNLTCALPNIYPNTNVSLNWYQEGRGPLDGAFSISRQKEDGTFDLTNTWGVSETGNWTCKASYLSVEGMEYTTTPISVTILDGTDDPDSPVNLVPIIVPIVVAIAVVVGIVVFILMRGRQQHEHRATTAQGQYGHVGKADKLELGDKGTGGIEDEKLANIAEALQDEIDLSKLGRNLGFRQFKLNQVIRGNERANDVFATTSMLFDWKKKTPAIKQVSTMVKALDQSGLQHFIDEFFPDEAGVSDEKLSSLAESLQDDDAIEQLGINFGFRQFKVNQYIKCNRDHGDHSGTSAMLEEWRKKTPRTRQIPELVEALKNSNMDTSLNNNKGSSDEIESIKETDGSTPGEDTDGQSTPNSSNPE